MNRRSFLGTAATLLLPTVCMAAIPMHVGDPAFLGRRRGSGNDGTACAVTAADGGGDTFDCYADQDPIIGSLAFGTGWTGAWVQGDNYVGTWGVETFESYSDGTAPAGGGTGWSGNWATGANSY